MLELYTHPMSPCAQKVRIVLAEKGLEWHKRHVNLQEKENLRPEYLVLNPLGVVPTLVHNGRPVIESSIICEYLDEAHGAMQRERRLYPEDPMGRAEMRRIMEASGQEMPEVKPIFEFNPNHPLLERLDAEPDEDRFAELVGILFDQASLAEGGNLTDPAAYVEKLNRLLLELLDTK